MLRHPLTIASRDASADIRTVCADFYGGESWTRIKFLFPLRVMGDFRVSDAHPTVSSRFAEKEFGELGRQKEREIWQRERGTLNYCTGRKTQWSRSSNKITRSSVVSPSDVATFRRHTTASMPLSDAASLLRFFPPSPFFMQDSRGNSQTG